MDSTTALRRKQAEWRQDDAATNREVIERDERRERAQRTGGGE